MMSVREIDRSLEQWQMDGREFAPAAYFGADAPGASPWQAQEMVRHLAAGPRLEGSGHGGGAGKGPSHHRTMGGGLRCGRAQRPDIRADRWFPPALGEAQREELRAAVQQLPTEAGMDLANWNLRRAQEEGGASVCLGTLRPQPVPQ